MMNDEMLRTIIETVFDLGKRDEEADNPTDYEDMNYGDDDSVTLTYSTLKDSLKHAKDEQIETTLEQLRKARYNCSPFYADGLEHAMDLIGGELN